MNVSVLGIAAGRVRHFNRFGKTYGEFTGAPEGLWVDCVCVSGTICMKIAKKGRVESRSLKRNNQIHPKHSRTLSC